MARPMAWRECDEVQTDIDILKRWAARHDGLGSAPKPFSLPERDSVERGRDILPTLHFDYSYSPSFPNENVDLAH